MTHFLKTDDREREGIRRDMEDVQEGVMPVLPADH